MLITDAVDFLIDPATGDFPPPGQNIDVSRGLAAVVQGARIRLALIAGEWFLDLDLGVAYFARPGIEPSRVIFGARFLAARSQREYRAALLGANGRPGVPGLLELTRLDVTFNTQTRTQTVIWQGRTIFGDTEADTLAFGES